MGEYFTEAEGGYHWHPKRSQWVPVELLLAQKTLDAIK
jgi:hypothetical protein